MHSHKEHPTDHTNDFFPLPLDLREIGEGKWQLLSDYIYDDIEFGEIRVPKGFVSDLYSVPRIVRSIVSKVQDSNGPAVIHDWLYRSQLCGTNGQKVADKILNRAMREHWSPVSWWKRKKIIAGLRIAGFIAYGTHASRVEQLQFILNRTPDEKDIIKKL